MMFEDELPLSIVTGLKFIQTMESEKYIQYQTTEEFILDKEFSSWVLHPDKELDQFWNSFLMEHPDKAALIKDAALIIKSLQPLNQNISQEKLDEIYRNIRKSGKVITLKRFTAFKYAAGILLMVATAGLIWLSLHQKNQFPIEALNNSTLKGKIILANGLTKEFDTEQTTIRQTTTGNLTINNDTIDAKSNKVASEMNQIIIPFGKRSEITLADGTHIWLNSGSQLSYPTEFKADSREVYLSGEAFFDVTSNPNQPFYVITHDIRVKVLGTSFNVSSYNEDNTTETVLVKGKVSAGKNVLFGKTINLVPGERMIYNKSNESVSKDRVDVAMYASWVKGYLIFDNIPITDVYKKLERYYNLDITAEDGLEKITFSGKLDLKESIKDVLENISFASSLKVFENNGSYFIKR